MPVQEYENSYARQLQMVEEVRQAKELLALHQSTLHSGRCPKGFRSLMKGQILYLQKFLDARTAEAEKKAVKRRPEAVNSIAFTLSWGFRIQNRIGLGRLEKKEQLKARRESSRKAVKRLREIENLPKELKNEVSGQCAAFRRYLDDPRICAAITCLEDIKIDHNGFLEATEPFCERLKAIALNAPDMKPSTAEAA